MKKNLDIVTADPKTLQWALEALQQASPGPEGAADLTLGLRGLLDGTGASLLLETGEGREPAFSRDRILCGDLEIRLGSRRVFRDRQEIFLTPKEFEILAFLAKNRGQIFTKEQIYQAVWEDVYLMDDSNIMAFIRKIRKKIERTPDDPQYILTVWGIGYQFNDTL